jgi:hypothetical protein
MGGGGLHHGLDGSQGTGEKVEHEPGNDDVVPRGWLGNPSCLGMEECDAGIGHSGLGVTDECGRAVAGEDGVRLLLS